jgi:hypothetical protein
MKDVRYLYYLEIYQLIKGAHLAQNGVLREYDKTEMGTLVQ